MSRSRSATRRSLNGLGKEVELLLKKGKRELTPLEALSRGRLVSGNDALFSSTPELPFAKDIKETSMITVIIKAFVL